VPFSIVPQNRRFYAMFSDMARLLTSSAEALVDLLTYYENVEMKTAHLKDLEHDADGVTHELYRLVHQTFVTPFDREDIAALAQSLDDVVDFIEATATTLNIYGIEAPTKPALGLADITRLQCVQIERAMELLGQKGKLRQILEIAKEINRLENEADSLFLQTMAELFHGERPTIEIIRWRDIYESLESATDSCERVAHVLESIVLKHA
jgi:predicted phosphate transport protein (TIGR00153 family)